MSSVSRPWWQRPALADGAPAAHHLPETWQGVQHSACLWLGLLGTLACIIGLRSQPYTDLYYQLSFSALAVLLGVLTVLLYLRLLSVITVTRTAFIAYAVCLLLGLNDNFNNWVPHDQAIGVGLYWVAVLYAMAFVTFPTQAAVQVCRAIFLAAALICTARLGLLWNAGQLTSMVAASAAQYLIFNGVLVLAHLAVSRLRLQLDQVRAVAYLDVLTGLPNRRYAQQQLEGLVAAQQAFCVVSFDIDYFKAINDSAGHEAGDRVLCEIALVVKGLLAAPYFLARWGGEEFVLVLPGLGRDGARTLAEQVRLVLADHPFPPVGRLTASFGVSQWAAGNDVEAVLRRADAALYAAKRAGRNGVQVAQDDGSPLGRPQPEIGFGGPVQTEESTPYT